MDTDAFKQRFPNYYCLPDAAWELVDRARKEGSRDFNPAEVHLALDTFKLFVLAADSGGPSRQQQADFDMLPWYHRALLREVPHGEITWTVATGPGDRDLVYSAKEDSLPDAVRKLKELLSEPPPRGLVMEPQWFQLATIAAAKAGLLPPRATIMVSEAGAVMERVNRAYRNALMAKQLHGQPLGRSDGLRVARR